MGNLGIRGADTNDRKWAAGCLSFGAWAGLVHNDHVRTPARTITLPGKR